MVNLGFILSDEKPLKSFRKVISFDFSSKKITLADGWIMYHQEAEQLSQVGGIIVVSARGEGEVA